MTTFALVHGAWHGAWCWDRLTPLLEERGHAVITMDLPIENPSATFETYADVVAGALDGAGDDVVLVGHSLAGQTIPLVPQRRRVARLVYLCALIPDPGKSFADQLLAEEGMLDMGYAAGLGEPDAERRREWVDAGLARRYVYGDCDEESVTAAIARLRPQTGVHYSVPCPLTSLPDVSVTSILCTEDRLVLPEWSRRVARERLGVEPVELPGSHSPFWSRPQELADVLDRVA